jgi:iron complex outermembrane receptor protein
MKKGDLAILCAMFFVAVFVPSVLRAQGEQENQSDTITASEKVQVTATRIPEAVDPEPASISIVNGDQLRATGANDLATALSLVQGISIAPGGDSGPASSIPEIWGLREFDAFLLVVDNVPWGGAFNPALATLDLNDVERIEILRGAAPVMYGATSFVGVIHVIHRSASDPGKSAHAYIGNFSTGGGSARFALPSSESWKHALAVNFDQQGFRDDRTQFDRAHMLYRGETKLGEGQFHLDVDLNFLRQDPASPHPRAGQVLDPSVPLDANHNPSDSQQDENRFHLAAFYDRQLAGADWSVISAITHAGRDITKGFLSDVSNDVDPNTAGYRQTQDETDIYLDTHFVWHLESNVRLLAGGDYLGGRGNAKAENFDYFINLDGSNPPDSHSVPVQERPQLDDERDFFGVYSQLEWNASTRLLIQGGLRFNSTHEKRDGEVLPGDAGGEDPGEEGGADTRSDNRLSGTIGASYAVVVSADNQIWIYADYRNAFKPAAIDFGPEVEGGILKPETANSYEGGIKGESLNGKIDWEFSVFRMDFENLVTSTVSPDGLPVLINSGKERFTGQEIGISIKLPEDFRAQFGYSHHSAKFVDFVQEFDEVPTQLAGNKLEMSPENLAAVGLIYSPATGFQGSFILNYVGDRFLNKRNTALADSFTTVSLGAGYRFGRNSVRFDIENVGDVRDPVSESELGDAQYYLMPARNFRFGWQFDF